MSRRQTSPGTAGATAVGLALLVAGLLGVLAPVATGQQDGASVAVTSVRGAITPVIAEHLRDTVTRAAADGHAALVVQLDTPGGLVTSMREIVQGFLNAPLPVIVYVSPSGADAGSAGTFITLAAHVAAMAPATTIGAATPVALEGGEVGDKVVNNAAAYAEAVAEERDRDVEFAVDAVREGRSVTATEAEEIGAVDLIVPDVASLLDEVDGQQVEVDGGQVTLETAGARQVDLEMSGVRRLLQAVADPNLAFIFLSIGTLAILYELANPGIGAGGIVGVVSIVLAMFSLSVLPVNYAGAALVVLGVGMIIAEAFTPAFGVAGVGGSLALVLGGLFLFQRPTGIGVDLTVLVPTGVVVLLLTLLAARLIARSRGRPSRVASDALIGRTAEVRVEGGPPHVRLDGIRWRVRGQDGITLRDRQDVAVVGRDNLELLVRPTSHDASREAIGDSTAPDSPTTPDPTPTKEQS